MVAKIFFIIVAICITFECIEANAPYKDCGSTATIKSFTVTNCTTAPCLFIKNNNYSLTIDFVANSNSNKVSIKLYGIISGVPVPFPLPEEDACKAGIKCPVQKGQEYVESSSLQVLPAYPSISLVAKFQLLDDGGEPMICILLPCKIQ